jgi:hypothetical protein
MVYFFSTQYIFTFLYLYLQSQFEEEAGSAEEQPASNKFDLIQLIMGELSIAFLVGKKMA